MGNDVKKIEENEKETVIVQRRCIRAANNLDENKILSKDDLTALRPCPDDGIAPYEIDKLLGKKMKRSMAAGEYLKWEDFE